VILQRVLSMAMGSGVYVQLVSRQWQRCYAAAFDTFKKKSELRYVVEDRQGLPRLAHLSDTLYRSVFSSASCLIVALTCGLSFKDNVVVQAAGRYSSTETMKRVLTQQPTSDTVLLQGALETGHCEVVQYLHSEGIRLKAPWVYQTSKNENLTALKWLYDKGGFQLDDLVAAMCSSTNHSADTKVLQWLKKIGYSFDYATELMCEAARNGCGQVVQFLIDGGCEVNAYIALEAAYGGHLHTLKLLHANGCSWDADAIGLAYIYHPYKKVDAAALQWFADVGVIWKDDTLYEMLIVCGGQGYLDAAQWLKAHGAEWPDVRRD
jgi:hypothetical protein